MWEKEGTGYLTRLCVPLMVVIPLRGWNTELLLALQKCVNLDAQEQWTGLA